MSESEPVAQSAPEEASQWDQAFTLRGVLAAVRRRWWLVLSVFVAIVALGAWRALTEPRRYRAVATVRATLPQQLVAGAGAQRPDFTVDRLESERQIIASRSVAERAAQQLGLRLRIVRPDGLRRSALFGEHWSVVDSAAPTGEYRLLLGPNSYSIAEGGVVYSAVPYGTPATGRGFTVRVPNRPEIDDKSVALGVVSPTGAAGEVQSGLGSGIREKTDLIEISYVGTDPVYVRDIANAVALAYRKFSAEERVRQGRAKTLAIRNARADLLVSLEAARRDVQAFRERYSTADVTAEQAALLVRIGDLEEKRQEAKLEQAVYAELIGGLQRSDTTTEQLRRLVGTAAVRENSSIEDLYSRWFELSKERSKLLTTLDTTAGDVRRVDELITQTKRDLQASSETYLQNLRSRISSYESSLEQLRTELKRFPSLQSEQEKLLVAKGTLETRYADLLSQEQLSEIGQAGDQETILLIDRAVLPQWPVSPNRRRMVLLAAAFGLLLGTLLAVGLERLDNSVKSPDELRDQLELTVLGLIPAIKSDGAEGTPAAGRLITHADPRSSVAEAYRSLRTNLAFARAQRPLQTIVLTSPGPADGKSTTAANLAITFAQQGQRTLIVDADLRRAVLDKTFSVPRSPGLTDVILGSVTLIDAVRPTEVPNLSVLGSGHFPPNPSELLGSPNMRGVLETARQHFDLVLFDSPPVLAVTDAAVLSTIVDGTILVVRMGSTAREAVRRALGQLRAVHSRVLGGVLNDVDMKRAGSYGGYGYYYYYSYYGSDGNGRDGRRDGGLLDGIRRRLGRRATAGRPT